jgi:hypothetical protein
MQHVAEQDSEGEDDEDWEELREQKIEQLRWMLCTLDPRHCAEQPGAVHPNDEIELKHFFRQQRGVAAWRVVSVLTPLLTFVDGLREPDPLYSQSRDASQQSGEASQQSGEASQQSTESQLEQEMLDDENRSQTPEWTASVNRRGTQQLEEPDSLKRLRAPSGAFGSPDSLERLRAPSGAFGSSPRSAPGSGAASSSGQHVAPHAQRAGRPSQLAANGAEAMKGVKAVSAMAHNTPGRAMALFDEQQAAAPEATLHSNIVAKSKVVVESIFQTCGNINETIAVVKEAMLRPEMRPILLHLGWSQSASSDSLMVDSIARFIEEHVDSSFRDLGSRSGGTRSRDAQAAHQLLVKAASCQELIDERKLTEAAKRLGVRFATFRYLVEFEDGR